MIGVARDQLIFGSLWAAQTEAAIRHLIALAKPPPHPLFLPVFSRRSFSEHFRSGGGGSFQLETSLQPLAEAQNGIWSR